MSSRVKVEGEQELVSYLRGATGIARMASMEVIAETALGMQGEAKQNAPVDTGKMRASIQSAFFSSGLSAEVFVGSDYGSYVDRGTGVHNLDSPRAPYFPPSSALANWARRHGMAGKEWLIARAIFRRGGTKARPFFTLAVEAWAPKYVDMLAMALGRRL